ncbi:hypothetical protein MMC07_002316 [Pseudocyphellaria aurata]|nr:hypothetical protein [Pseudocyphellaria aurata]
MATGGDQAHSILEHVTKQPQYQAEQFETLTNDPEKQQKQVAIDGGKECIEDKGGLEVAPNEHFANDDFNEDFDRRKIVVHGVPGQRLPARSRKLLCGLAGLTIILGAILGGVLGTRHKNSATVSVTPIQRNIAAVSYTTNHTNHTRVYFQNEVGQIIEASNSELNETWSVKMTGFGGKNGSVIAAAVLHQDIPLEISIFYLDANNVLHDISYTASTGNYTSGTLSDQGYTTLPNSSLSATYDWCRLCANTTIIAFQDERGFLRIGNYTSGGWTLRQPADQSFNPEMGTGLALQQSPINDVMYSINLFYQNSESGPNMALASWSPNFQAGADNGWLFYPSIDGPVPSSAHMAAASISSQASHET